MDSTPGAETVHIGIEPVAPSTFEPSADSATSYVPQVPAESVINLSSHAMPPLPPTAQSSRHIVTVLIALIILLAGFVSGGASGYFYAMWQQPSVQLPPFPQRPVATPAVDNTAAAATSTNPLNAVKTNPFE